MAEILLVEDDEIVQHVHKLIFDKLGHSVDLVDTGVAALDKLKAKSSYRIIFVDIGLPDMNGFDLIKEIRKNPDNCGKVPVIALTGYIGEPEKNLCFEAGATDVIHKPILMNTMLKILKQYL